MELPTIFGGGFGGAWARLGQATCKGGEDGRTAWERRKGKRFNRRLPEIGEWVWLLKALSEGKGKMDTRWEDGIYLGVRPESTEAIVGNEKAVVKARTFAMIPEKERDGRRKNSTAFRGYHGNPCPKVWFTKNMSSQNSLMCG